mgnify:CR=1 FL=1
MKEVLVLRQVPHETLGTIELALRAAGLPHRYVDLFDDPPGSLDLSDALGMVVLGGPMNVDQTDDYPFLADEVRWIGDALARHLPLLGVCLGAQLLAKTLGARVYPNGSKEIGWYEIDLLPAAGDDTLLHGFGDRLPVFQWHGDTFDLPSGAVQLARGALCAHQAFRFGASAWGLQFHVEMTEAIVYEWLDEPGNRAELAGVAGVDPDAIRQAAPRRVADVRRCGDTILSRFAAVCAGVAAQ